jgi:hypothetical protein
MCLLVFFSYRQGLKDGRAVKEEMVLDPIIQMPKKKQEIPYEIKKFNTIMDNINNYNGGPVGQKEVK